MLSILDVAKYFVDHLGEVPSEKLLYICFYAQGKHLLETDKPLFKEDFIVRKDKLYLFSSDERFFSFRDTIGPRHFTGSYAPIGHAVAEELDGVLAKARTKDFSVITDILPPGPMVITKPKLKYLTFKLNKILK